MSRNAWVSRHLSFDTLTGGSAAQLADVLKMRIQADGQKHEPYSIRTPCGMLRGSAQIRLASCYFRDSARSAREIHKLARPRDLSV